MSDQDELAEVAYKSLIDVVKRYREHPVYDTKELVEVSVRQLSAIIGSCNLSASCYARCLHLLKYVEYTYLGVRYWGPQDEPDDLK